MAMDAARGTWPLLAARRFFTHAEVSADSCSLPGLPQPDYTAADVVRHLLGPDYQAKSALRGYRRPYRYPSLRWESSGRYGWRVPGPPLRAGTKPGNDVPARRHNGQ